MDSKIIISKGIHIDRDYKNVTSLSVSDMLNVMQAESHYIDSSDKFSFIRTQNKLSTPFSYDDCIQSNYIAFQNPSYSDKWFFAFIDDVYYKSNGCTELTFTVDAWTTFWSDWIVKPCLTVREHVSDDTIGLHTLDEGLDTGEDFIEESQVTMSGYSDYFYVAVETTYKPNNNSHARTNPLNPVEGEQYNGIAVYNKNVFGAQILLFDSHIEDATHGEYTFAYNLLCFLQRVALDEHIGDIRNIYIIPSVAVPASDLTQYTCYMTSDDSTPFSFDLLNYSINPKTATINIPKLHSYTGVNIKNNKCFVYPFNFLEVTNNCGNRQVYKYEQFSNANNATFETILAILCGCSGMCYPTNYKNQSKNKDESLALGKFPTCSWSSDAYLNFLTQESINNMKNIVFQTIGSIMNVTSTALGAMSGSAGKVGATSAEQMKGGAETGMSGASGLLSLAKIGADVLGQNISRDLAPENYAGSNNSTVNFSNGDITYVFKSKRVKNENLQAIDDYFTKFGYKVSRLKTPNLHSRTYWNYVEIAQSEDIGNGDVPTTYMEIINNACRRGVTIWHNHENIGNYNLNNTIVT